MSSPRTSAQLEIAVWEALQSVVDPELGVRLVDLGTIRSVDVLDDRVASCSVRAALRKEITMKTIVMPAECHADLIVMATRGRSGIRRRVLGSVADKVMHAMSTPLLLVHAGEGALP